MISISLFIYLFFNSTILTPKAIQMLKANTNFTEEQIREWHAGFLRDW
jgi:Ca2+-binding EF-hand superfamily protein